MDHGIYVLSILSVLLTLQIFNQVSSVQNRSPALQYPQRQLNNIISHLWKFDISNFELVYPAIQENEREKIDATWKNYTDDNNRNFDAVNSSIRIVHCRVSARRQAASAYSRARFGIKTCVLNTMSSIRLSVFNCLRSFDRRFGTDEWEKADVSKNSSEVYIYEVRKHLESRDTIFSSQLTSCSECIQRVFQNELGVQKDEVDSCISVAKLRVDVEVLSNVLNQNDTLDYK